MKKNNVIILGCGRSGSSILGELFDHLPEYDYFFEPDLNNFSVEINSGSKKNNRIAVKIPKGGGHITPGLTCNLDHLIEIMNSDYKIIWIVRNPLDTICSLKPGIETNWQHNPKPPNYQELLSKPWYIKCAHHWDYINKIGFNNVKKYSDPLIVKFENLINHTKTTVSEILNFIQSPTPITDLFNYIKLISNNTGKSYHAKKQNIWFIDNHKHRINRYLENMTYFEIKSSLNIVENTSKFYNYSFMTKKDDIKQNDNFVELFNQPNKYARLVSIETKHNFIYFHGYQEFILTTNTIIPLDIDVPLKKKHTLLKDFFTPHFLSNRSFLDIGANAGFFSFWALQNNAAHAYALDIDQEYLDVIQKGKERFNFNNLDIINTNITDWNEPADVVLALALVHWIYSCTALYGSLDSVIKKLAELTKYMLIVEWVDPSDSAIQFFNHIQWNADNIDEPYTFGAFKKSLEKYFNRITYIGDFSDTRKLFVAFKSNSMIDLSVPFPLVRPVETLISSRLLTSINGIDYWSCVFDVDHTIIKQATLNLANREAFFLNQFKSKHFPKVLNSWSENGYSVIALEKILGPPIEQILNDYRQDSQKMDKFIDDALSILESLRSKGIKHRDIRLDNLLSRDDSLVLIDFGWAETLDCKIYTPPLLGGDERAPDGNHCDIYSMGKVIEKVNRETFDYIKQLASLMANPDPALRTTDLSHLRQIWSVLKSKHQNSRKE